MFSFEGAFKGLVNLSRDYVFAVKLSRKNMLAAVISISVVAPLISTQSFAASRHSGIGSNTLKAPIKAERILCIDKSGRDWKTGTATVLDNGTRLTAHHVIEGCKVVYIGNKAVKVSYVDPSIDLAILGAGRDFRRLDCNAIPRGRRVSLKGYPEGASQLVVSHGKTSRSGRGRFASVEGFAVKGMSGGPVTQEGGQVAGIFQSYKGTSRYWYVPGSRICDSLKGLQGAALNLGPNRSIRPVQPIPQLIARAKPQRAIASEKTLEFYGNSMQITEPNIVKIADASGNLGLTNKRLQISVSSIQQPNPFQESVQAGQDGKAQRSFGVNHQSHLAEARPVVRQAALVSETNPHLLGPARPREAAKLTDQSIQRHVSKKAIKKMQVKAVSLEKSVKPELPKAAPAVSLSKLRDDKTTMVDHVDHQEPKLAMTAKPLTSSGFVGKSKLAKLKPLPKLRSDKIYQTSMGTESITASGQASNLFLRAANRIIEQPTKFTTLIARAVSWVQGLNIADLYEDKSSRDVVSFLVLSPSDKEALYNFAKARNLQIVNLAEVEKEPESRVGKKIHMR